MSTISSLSSSHLISSQPSTYPNTQLAVCVSPAEESKQDFLPTPLITPQNSNSFYGDNTTSNVNSQDFIHRLCHQKSRLMQLYDCEIARQQPTSSLLTFLDSIDQLVNEYENYRSIIDDIAKSNKQVEVDQSYSQLINLDISSLHDAVVVNQLFVEQTSKQPERLIDNINDETMNCESNLHTDYDDHSYSKVSRNNKQTTKKSTILQLKRYKYEGCCPLTTRAYGLDPNKHGIRHFPCTRVTAPINLYKHLIQYHQLTHSPTMQIVRLLADEKEEGDIDLFSSQSTSLIATHPTVYRAQCPLNQYGKFGITAEHKIRLCTQPNQPIGAPLITPKDVCLYDHFVVYHQMKRSCAQRLAEAIVKNKTEPVFRPDEQLLNDTFYIQCPLRHSKAICWKSPISSRHMGQHLTGIHKLDEAARRQIMMALRKQPTSSADKKIASQNSF
ncbi:unnamed protein product [Rotaria magnacalcarata]|uniref:Uncharacterized protein n=3 Tax=Rotaria magnacalcarata TaxID=392030 RepID=A0A816FEF9_9BILA|nr:unnamed protein product [Rotaria magnacalcarata]CAF1660512.1 unnamed protein product [Rotaria magnacalcarata]CAF2226304.1 unnamed protein product [Rotaria magnacalcarata]CAF3778890.1 unnamed protein product [Rotaria magnacalcarata]CAF3881142.1 unnamed protein product [Rotaria magnacalcarata]